MAEHDALIRQLWNEGLSSTQIAQRIGRPDATHGAWVRVRVQRMGLPSRRVAVYKRNTTTGLPLKPQRQSAAPLLHQSAAPLRRRQPSLPRRDVPDEIRRRARDFLAWRAQQVRALVFEEEATWP